MKKPFFQRVYDFFFGPLPKPPEFDDAEYVDLAPYRAAPHLPTPEEIHKEIAAAMPKPKRVRSKPKAVKPAVKPKTPVEKKQVAKRPAAKKPVRGRR